MFKEKIIAAVREIVATLETAIRKISDWFYHTYAKIDFAIDNLLQM